MHRETLWSATGLLVCASLIALAVTAAACAVSSNEPLAIGFVGGLTGRTSDLGTAGRDGALLAVEQFNAAGGLDGRDVVLKIEDDKQDPVGVERAYRSLVERGVVAVIGPMTSSMGVEIAPLAAEIKVPVLSPTISTDALTGQDDWFFRLYPDNSSAAAELASVTRADLGDTHVAVIYDLANRAHTETWIENYAAAFRLLGGTVVATETITSGYVPEYKAAVSAALATEPDSVFLLANALDTALLATMLREHGFEGDVIASEWSATEVVVSYGGRAVEGMYFLNTIDTTLQSDRFLQFRGDFRERFGYEAGFASIHAFDAVNIVLSLLNASDSPQAFRDRLAVSATHDTLQGQTEMDQYGDVYGSYHLTTIRDGLFVPGP